jgi:hypothetical protein
MEKCLQVIAQALDIKGTDSISIKKVFGSVKTHNIAIRIDLKITQAALAKEVSSLASCILHARADV